MLCWIHQLIELGRCGSVHDEALERVESVDAVCGIALEEPVRSCEALIEQSSHRCCELGVEHALLDEDEPRSGLEDPLQLGFLRRPGTAIASGIAPMWQTGESE